MEEKELIKLIANIWIANGGDAEGIEWCWAKIRDEVKKQLRNNK